MLRLRKAHLVEHYNNPVTDLVRVENGTTQIPVIVAYQKTMLNP
ncbi:MAG TPA: hypothetical protein VFS12_08690 [Terriglobia bacterium]|nr:hypothetical protein [Terriglobia bacterium]